MKKKRGVYLFILGMLLINIIIVISANLDLNNDGSVNTGDLDDLANYYRGKTAYNASYDLNNDAKVDLFDLVALARNANFGPVAITNPSPSGTVLNAGTTQTTISVTTDRSATCHYSLTDQAYDSMVDAFSGAGGTSHSGTLTGLTNGTSYTVYARCKDSVGNINPTSTTFSFSVAVSPGSVPPDYEELWEFNSVKYDNGGASPRLVDSPYHSDSGTAEDTLYMVKGLTTPWAPSGNGYAVRRPVVGGVVNSVGFAWDVPSVAQGQHVWIELYMRWDTTWHLTSVPGQTTDDKTIFWLAPANPRWELKFVNGAALCYIDSNPPPGETGTTSHGSIPGGEAGQADGQWHQVRVELQRSTTNGIYKMWWDGTKLVDMNFNGQDNYPTTWMALGRNLSPAYDSWMDFGRMRIWNNDPGW